MYKLTRPWIICAIEGANAAGATTPATAAEPTAATPATPGSEREHSTLPAIEKDSDDSGPDADDEEDPNARGSKTQVLKDLACARDKRQQLEAKRDEARKRIEELESQAAQRQREADIKTALAKAKLPAEMAGRFQGETLEELTADARALAKEVGFDRSALDPSQSQINDRMAASTLSEAIGNHYGVSR
ncbi:hypothetical protein [Corynebacterium phoceense]|uniref:hypothetical protein n=1 Tax=Corynebacterium phoceense TaxID=1686286 RepID=UPI0018AC3559|nr:hypothetical protein [Corynebacterium phoceense]MBF9012201.1 hypothetical protein [Corynebacterium phoceense]